MQAAAARSQQQLRALRQRLRELRRQTAQWQAAAARIMPLEAEIAELRRAVGPQRPLFPVSPPSVGASEPWIPQVVEAHLTALNDHDPLRAASLFAPDGCAIDAAMAQPPACSHAAVAAFHRVFFETWLDYRFFPRAWHNLRSAAFLEGEASFVLSPHAQPAIVSRFAGARPVSVDMLLVYDIRSEESGNRITRFKVYYDAATILKQLRQPAAQGSLF